MSKSNSEGSQPSGKMAGETATGRKAAMALLAQATAQELQAFWAHWTDRPTVDTLRGPETGLVMMRGRIGGGGAPFNLGEATVTRATVLRTAHLIPYILNNLCRQ